MHMRDEHCVQALHISDKSDRRANIFFYSKHEKRSVYAVDKGNRKHVFSTMHIFNTVYRIRHSQNVVEE
jgi:hypothetical protein